MIVVVSGPGGVGKGTVVRQLVQRDPRLWLSRSWTTRQPRPGEAGDAYEFVDEDRFRARIAAGGFLEWAEFLGHLYGTPTPDPGDDDRDLLLEIEVQGAAQVRQSAPDALLILLVTPDRQTQRARLEQRGDAPDKVVERLRKADEEVAAAQALGAIEVVNDTVDDAVERLLTVIDEARASGGTS